MADVRNGEVECDDSKFESYSGKNSKSSTDRIRVTQKRPHYFQELVSLAQMSAYAVLSERHSVSRYKRKRNFLHAGKSSTVFSAIVSTCLTDTTQLYVQISYNYSHLSRTTNEESMGRNLLTPPV